MTAYEYHMSRADKCLEAARSTYGFIRSVWLRAYDTEIDKAENLIAEEAEKPCGNAKIVLN